MKQLFIAYSLIISNIYLAQENEIKVKSSVKEVKVFLSQASIKQTTSKYDKTTGKLTWTLNINPGEEKKVSFKYTVTYPKNKIIYNL